MHPTSLPGQPLPQHIQAPAANATQVGTGTPEDLARQFHASPVAWNAHLPAVATTTTTSTTTTHTAATTTTTTTTSTATSTARTDVSNSSLGAPAHPTSRAAAQVVTPQWLQDLTADDIRGDECFRARYGDGVSLLDDEGRINTGFTRDPTRCHARLRGHAERLAAIMKVRNDSVAAARTAEQALQAASNALRDEQEKYGLARSAAQRMNIPLNDPSLLAHETAVAQASRSLDAARQELDALTKALSQTQQLLRDVHTDAEKQVAQSDDALNNAQEEEVRIAIARADDLARARGGPAGPLSLDPTTAVYATSVTIGSVAAMVANAQHVYASALLEMLDLTTHAGRLLDSVLRGVGYETGHRGVPGADDVPIMAALDPETRNLVFGIFIGVFLAHLLIQSGRLDI